MDDLLGVQVHELVDAQAQVPVLLRITDNIDYVLEVLGSSKILSAPVLDIDEKVVLGFIDYLDVANYLVDHLGDGKEDNVTTEQKKQLLNRSIRNAGLLAYEKRDPFIIILGEHPASLLVKGFNSGIHRIVFYDDETKISGICSQSDVLKYVHSAIAKADRASKEELDKFLLCPVEKLGWGKRPVLSVSSSETVMYCLSTMRENQISAVAILDQHGVLVGNFSASDLRGISTDFVSFLHVEVKDFLALRSSPSLQPCTVKRESTVEEVLETLVQSHLHHVWITDENERPTGIITLTDVMGALYSFNPTPPRMALSTPGFLDVEIVRARHLKSGWFSCHPYVVVKFPDRPRSTFRTTTGSSTDPVWEGQKFRIPISSRNYRDRVLFIAKDKHMIGSDDDLGYFLLRLDWVLNGFGSGSPVCTSTCDWFDLHTKDRSQISQGQIELRLSYKLMQC